MLLDYYSVEQLTQELERRGYVVVPKEPTEEMLDAAMKNDAEWYPISNRAGRLQLAAAYRAAIAAAPEPQE